MSVRKTVNSLLGKLEKSYIPHSRIEVSSSAILHNLDFFTRLNNMPAIPVLKGNAYGHGIDLVARILKARKLPYIAVDGYFEALRIREVSRQPVLVMGAIHPENYKRMKYDNFAFVVHDEASIRALGETRRRLKIHLEINTGMNRYGVKPGDVPGFVQLIQAYKNLTLEGVMSHLADSDGDDPTTVHMAVRQFDSCVEAIRSIGVYPTIIHIAQSAGSLTSRSKYATAFRLGIGLYGINPFPKGHDMHERLKNLRPALTLKSTVTKIINLQKGDKVSYNYTFTAAKDMKIGVLPLGYYEGVNRALSNVGSVKINGKFTKIVGRVCMNHTMVSLDGVSAKEGDEVTIYSGNPADENAIDSLSYRHKLFNYTILTALSRDVRRVLVK